jgi:hypothetical protein
MAMLFHDTGKLINAHQPRRHSKISGRLWLKHKPDWFPEGKTALVKWMVETHDLFGAFGRGITEKRGHEVGDYDLNLELATSYFGGLDSQAVRIKLRESGLPFAMAVEINKEIWMADIGSIASLRWLLPVAEMVARLILVGAPPDRREREKGSAVLQDTLERRVRIRRKE